MVRLFSEILGKEVELPERPSRIVSFSPALTETLFMLGTGGSVVGVSAFCARPAEAKSKRRVGSYSTVRYEVLDELRPDLIVTVTGYQREFAVRLSKRYTVFPLELPTSVSGIVDVVTKLGIVVGAESEAGKLSSSLLRTLASAGEVAHRLVYLEMDLGGPVTFGAVSYITDAVRYLGSETLFDGVRKEWLVPDLAKVPGMDPDVIVYEPKMYSRFDQGDLARLLAGRGWGSMRAVAAGNVFLTPGPLDFLAHHGPSFITEAIPWLRESLSRAEANA